MPPKKKTRKAKSSTAVTEKTVAPSTVKAEKSAVTRKKRPSEATIKAILEQVAQLKLKGTSIVQALKDLKVPYANYHYWVKKYGAGEATSNTGGAESKRAASSKRPVRGSNVSKAKKMQAVIDGIAAMRANGTSLNMAVKKHGLSVNNYYYWVKRLQAKGAGATQVGRRTAPSAKTGSISDLLDAMKRNRAESEKLDAEWQELKRRLEREG